MREHIFNLETGLVKDESGEPLYYIEFNESESYILYRGLEGEIKEFFRSGNKEREEPKEHKTPLYDKYIDWNYYDKLD